MRRAGVDPTPLVNEIWSAGSYGAPQTYVSIDRAIRRYLDGAPNPFPGGFEKGGTGGLRAFSRAMEVVFSCNDYPLLWKKEASQADRRIQLKRAVRDYPRRRFFPFTPAEISSSTFTGYRYCLKRAAARPPVRASAPSRPQARARGPDPRDQR